VSCHDARELFSALLDETLTREERADVYGHLATCPDCRRELEAVERTVALVRGAAPVRAPAGFVDRVVAAARPTPWYVRAARAALLPWPVKLPLGAAAILLVGGLAALVFRGVQEQQRAAQPPPALEDRRAVAEPYPGERAATSTAEPDRAVAAPAPPAATEDEASRDRAEPGEGGAKRPAAPPPAAQAPAPAKLETSPSMAAPTPDVVAGLRAPAREPAERGLAALAARLGGARTGRRVVGEDLVVDLAIPRERYADFRREAARFGDYRTESEASALPDTVRIAVHLRS
jgi:hypothetical protein